LWKKLHDECQYSLQVATKAAIEQDEELRNEYLEAVESIVKYLDQLVYLDEMQKGRNDARRRHDQSLCLTTHQFTTRIEW
jgi:hypothetical protein